MSQRDATPKLSLTLTNLETASMRRIKQLGIDHVCAVVSGPWRALAPAQRDAAADCFGSSHCRDCFGRDPDRYLRTTALRFGTARRATRKRIANEAHS